MLQFRVSYNHKIVHSTLFYDIDSHSFDMRPWDFEVEDFGVVFNKLSLSVKDYCVTQLCGFCGLDSSMLSNYLVPKHKKGQLKVVTNLDYGFCYGINDDEVPVYVNDSSGWVCIGNPFVQQQAVEFIENCIAVVTNKDLVALWLKPQLLPPLA